MSVKPPTEKKTALAWINLFPYRNTVSFVSKKGYQANETNIV